METNLSKARLPVIKMVRKPIILVVLFGLIAATLVIKGTAMGWFSHNQPLALNGQPALLFFTIARGCDCQMKVVQNAEAQLAAWQIPATLGLNVIQIDLNRRHDLARQHQVARAPALVLLDTAGQVVWKQDEGLSDEQPLDLATCLEMMTILELNP